MKKEKEREASAQQAAAKATILARIMAKLGNIPKRIDDNSKRSLLNVSALTNKHQVTVVSPDIDDSNAMSRNYQTIVFLQTTEDKNTKGRKRFWPDN